MAIWLVVPTDKFSQFTELVVNAGFTFTEMSINNMISKKVSGEPMDKYDFIYDPKNASDETSLVVECFAASKEAVLFSKLTFTLEQLCTYEMWSVTDF